MADAVISGIVEQVVSRSLQKIEEEVKLVKNAKIEVNKLKKNLRLVQALLEDAGMKQVESASVRQWLSDLEEVSYDMDDLLGDWNAAILKSEIQNEAKKVDFLFPFYRFPFFLKQGVWEVISLRQFSKKIKQLNEELDETKRLGNELGIVGRVVESSDQYGATNKPRITTTSFVDETKIQGRVQDKAVLVSKLVCESSGNGKGIEIVPIVGMGGLGKTTLAQLAYNDDRVKAHFDARIWVCVSDPFDIFSIAKAVVEGLGGKPSHYEGLQGMMQFISTSIEVKRFLLVLDDVWSRDKETWDQLIQPLQNDSSGSRILVTTRNKEVVMMMGVSFHNINTLKTLSDEQCCSIIKQLSLFEEDEESNDFTQLEVIGKKVAAKCKGLPLPAKILGGLMCFKKSEKQWEDILHSHLWESKAFDKIFAPFLISYYSLSPIEKCCFSYCAVFPKDEVIFVEMIIEMWMSQGYFEESSKGRDCFESLAMRSFFQDFGMSDREGDGPYFKMHDIVHDFAQYLTGGRFVLMEGDAIGEKMKSLNVPARHLSFGVKSRDQFATIKPEEMNIGCKFRTFLGARGFDLLNLTCFRTLRTFNLATTSDVFRDKRYSPKGFPTMAHLRYLDLSRLIYMEELPESLSDLSNLQTLRLSYNLNLKMLPKGFGKLVNLRHLYLYRCSRLEGFPKGFEKLTRLQKLDWLVVPENKSAYFDPSDLSKLSSLRFQGSLTVLRCRNFPKACEVEKWSIKTMEDLLTLRLSFLIPGRKKSFHDNVSGPAILEALRPHPNLKSLQIEWYEGSTMFPTWLPLLTNLTRLNIISCCNCEILPPLGRLPSLETLEIDDMNRVKKVGSEFLGIDGGESAAPFVSFPRLKELYFDKLHSWKEWEGISEEVRPRFLSVMPSLRSLTINSCETLEALPDFLLMTPLQTLSTRGYCENLWRWCREGAGKEWLPLLT